MTPEKAYRDLADRVEGAEAGDRDLEGVICQLVDGVPGQPTYWGNPPTPRNCVPSYTTSLDAAMTLLVEPWDHMEVYQPDHQTLGWTVHVFANANLGGQWSGFAQSHPLALVAAALRLRSHAARIGRVG